MGAAAERVRVGIGGAGRRSARARRMGSIGQQALSFALDVLGLRQDLVLKIGVMAGPVFGGHATDGGVEIIEQLPTDAGGDLGAVAEAEGVLVDDEDAAGLLDGVADGLPIVGARERRSITSMDLPGCDCSRNVDASSDFCTVMP